MIKRYLKYIAITLGVFIIVIILQYYTKKYDSFKIWGHILTFLTYIIGISMTIFSSENDKLIDRIFNFTVFIIFNSPLAIYTIILIFRTFDESFIKVGNSSVWIGFAGSIIGGSMTMFAIIFTIRNQDNIESKKVVPHISIDISDLYNIEKNLLLTTIRLDNGEVQLGGHDSCWINFILTNTSRFIAKNVKVQSIQTTHYNNDKKQTFNNQLFEINLNRDIDLLTPESKLNLKIFFDHKKYITGNYFDIVFITKHTDIFEFNQYMSRFVFRFCLNEILDQTSKPMIVDFSSLQFTESPLLATFSYSKIEDSINLEKK